MNKILNLRVGCRTKQLNKNIFLKVGCRTEGLNITLYPMVGCRTKQLNETFFSGLDVGLKEGDPGWLGAWWMGFIIISGLTIFIAPFLGNG